MTVKINLNKLSKDEQYNLRVVLEAIKNPEPSVVKAIEFLEEIARKDYDKLCRERGWSMML